MTFIITCEGTAFFFILVGDQNKSFHQYFLFECWVYNFEKGDFIYSGLSYNKCKTPAFTMKPNSKKNTISKQQNKTICSIQ